MDCETFLSNFSDIVDGTAPEELVRSAERHAGMCDSCRRYQRVHAAGTQLLRALPTPELGEDFHPRLRHRLFHVADEEAAGLDAASAVPALTVLGMSILLAVVAWSPVLGRAPEVELEPIVVSRPPSDGLLRPANALPGFGEPAVDWADLSTGLWDDPRALLYEYSELSQRYRRGSAKGPRTDRDR